jgi:Domain of unknown function (DUF5753)
MAGILAFCEVTAQTVPSRRVAESQSGSQFSSARMPPHVPVVFNPHVSTSLEALERAQAELESGAVPPYVAAEFGSMRSVSTSAACGGARTPPRLISYPAVRPAPSWDVERLASLSGRADQRTWLAPWNDIIPDWLKTYVGLEGLASYEINYSPLVLHALIQTEAYSRGATAGSARVRPDQVERLVGLRMERQHRLFSGTAPLRLTAIIEESVLDRPIGGNATMCEQLKHLVKLSARDNIDVLVLPTAIGRHDSLEGMFSVLHFEQAQSIGYIEYPDGAIYVQDQDQNQDQVAAYTRTAESLSSVASS